MGGEKFSSVMRQTSRRGSPPRGRGKGGIGIYKTFTHGITPAWAGKSIPVNDLFPSYEDHPRVGGEKARVVMMVRETMGSPPRGRGKEIEANRDAIAHRITPAWAGKR